MSHALNVAESTLCGLALVMFARRAELARDAVKKVIMGYIIELTDKIWIAPWYGCPGVTIKKEDAKVFESREEAETLVDKEVLERFENVKIRRI